MITESIMAKGNLKVELLDSNGNIKDKREIKNLVVAVGKDYIVDRMQSNLSPVMSHMAIGAVQGNVAPVTSQTALVDEVARVGLDSNTITNNTVTYVATFSGGVPLGGNTISEAGIFNEASGGTMLCRTRFNEVNKGNADIIVITWNITVQ
jgi:hypothetical protein